MNNIKKYFLIIPFIFFYQITVGQVCNEIINVCGNAPINSNPTDEDTFPDLVGDCVIIDGVRSVWYKIKIESGSELTFDITPSDPSIDYDFVVYGPNPDCVNVLDDTAIRANYSSTTGVTGLRVSGTGTCTPSGGDPFNKPISVRVGRRSWWTSMCLSDKEISKFPHNLLDQSDQNVHRII